MKEDLKTFWKTYFDFTKGERNAFFILIFLIAGVSAYPFISSWFDHSRSWTDFSEFESLAKNISSQSDKNKVFQGMPSKESTFHKARRRFKFDPNSATIQDFQALGFRSYVAGRIEKFRAHGGKFRIRSDLYKVYGIDSALIRELWSEIMLPETHERQEWKTGKEKWEKNDYAKQYIEINSADTAALVKLPGIGSRLALRIVQFRTRLGGFYSLEQLHEVYGIKPETIELIKPRLTLNLANIKPLNINTWDENMLEAHPYIDRQTARNIVRYREQHGPFASMEDLKKLVVPEASLLDKLKNYIKF